MICIRLYLGCDVFVISPIILVLIVVQNLEELICGVLRAGFEARGLLFTDNQSTGPRATAPRPDRPEPIRHGPTITGAIRAAMPFIHF